MSIHKDKDGDWLDGGTNYVLNVPADAPAEAFWSITVYDVDTRCLIRNEQKTADRSSRMDLLENVDGTVTIYIGPDKPKGDKAKNWIPTVPVKAWFPYFRLYSSNRRSWIVRGFCPTSKRRSECRGVCGRILLSERILAILLIFRRHGQPV